MSIKPEILFKNFQWIYSKYKFISVSVKCNIVCHLGLEHACLVVVLSVNSCLCLNSCFS